MKNRWFKTRGRGRQSLLAAIMVPGIAFATPPQTATCAACHGEAGLGNQGRGYPALARQSSRYLFWQLMDFKRGTRKNAVMQPIAHSLSKTEMTALADYYATLPVPVTPQPAMPSGGPGRELALRGIPHPSSAATPACDFCHGPNGTGAGPFPRLAGEPAAYLADQLRAWRHGARPAGPLGLMGHVAAELSAGDVQAVAAYYAALAPHPANEAHNGKSPPPADP